ncbi:MAG: ribosome-associated translation inhibitor RaiA [Patescibacteria group bacterium]|jgi:putative sigma-54 modulation protein
MKINIKATNAKLTPEAHEMINEKVGGLTKYFDNIIEVDVEIGLISFHHRNGDNFRAEINLTVPGTVLRAEAETDNIEKSINEAKDKMKQELIKYKEKKQE